MEPPRGPDERELRDAQGRRPARRSPADVAACRYGAGRIGDRAVPAYADEEGVDPARGTETFAEVVLELDSERWRGTRFVLRAGKALRRRRKGVVDPLPAERRRRRERALDRDRRPRPTSSCGSPAARRKLRSGGAPGEPPAAELPAYGRVLLDLLNGGSTLSVRGDEAEEAWRVVAPVLAAWRADRVPLEEYPAGSDGPRG